MLGGSPVFSDIRWVARVHAALFEPGKGPRRFNLGGHWMPWGEAFARFRKLTGRHLPTIVPTPRMAGLAMGRLMDLLQLFLPWRMPVAYENTCFTFNCAPTDDSPAERLAGPKPPLENTLADAIVWAVRAGHLPASLAGKLSQGT